MLQVIQSLRNFCLHSSVSIGLVFALSQTHRQGALVTTRHISRSVDQRALDKKEKNHANERVEELPNITKLVQMTHSYEDDLSDIPTIGILSCSVMSRAS